MKFRMIMVAILMTMFSGGAQAEILWNKPNVMPYTGTPDLALGKMVKLVPDAGVWAQLLVMAKTKEGCTRSVLVPGLQMAAMMSGQDKVLPNVRVGEWARTAAYPTGTWSCRVEHQGVEYYLLIPDACGNIALVVIQKGVCIPNPAACDRDCAVYVQEYIS